MTLIFGALMQNAKGFVKLIGFTEVDLTIQPSLSSTGTKVVNMASVKSIYVYSSLSVANVVTTSVNNFQNTVGTILSPVLPEIQFHSLKTLRILRIY